MKQALRSAFLAVSIFLAQLSPAFGMRPAGLESSGEGRAKLASALFAGAEEVRPRGLKRILVLGADANGVAHLSALLRTKRPEADVRTAVVSATAEQLSEDAQKALSVFQWDEAAPSEGEAVLVAEADESALGQQWRDVLGTLEDTWGIPYYFAGAEPYEEADVLALLDAIEQGGVPPPAAGLEQATFSPSQVRIAIVEDDEDIGERLLAAVKAAIAQSDNPLARGIALWNQIHWSREGKEAVAWIEAEKPQLVITDDGLYDVSWGPRIVGAARDANPAVAVVWESGTRAEVYGLQVAEEIGKRWIWDKPLIPRLVEQHILSRLTGAGLEQGLERAVRFWSRGPFSTPPYEGAAEGTVVVFKPGTHEAIPLVAEHFQVVALVESGLEEGRLRALLARLGLERRVEIRPAAELAQVLAEHREDRTIVVDPAEPGWFSRLMAGLEALGVLPLGDWNAGLEAVDDYLKGQV